MTTDRRLDETISRWLEGEAPLQLPDRVLRATFARTHETRQQGGWRALLGRLNVNRFVFVLGGAAVVLVAAVLVMGLYVNNPSPGVGGPGAVPTASSVPTTAPSPATQPETSPTADARPTSTPGAGLPEGAFDIEDNLVNMTVTIPASGWIFEPQFTVLMKGTEVANVPEAAILFWSFPAGTDFYVPGDPCRSRSTRPETPLTTVDDFAAALAGQESRDASQPVDVTVDGYAGKSITLHVPDDAPAEVVEPGILFSECEGGEFVSYGTEKDDLARTAQGPGQIDELWVLDVDGTFVIIDAMYRPDTPAELVEEMRSIAQSTQFETP